MKQLFIIIVCLSSIIQSSFSQSVGSWKSYLSYYNTTGVAEGNNYVFGVANGSLYSYNEDDRSIKYYSKETNPALSDNNITSISFNKNQKVLIVAYKNGNIDLLGEQLINLPYLKNNTSIQDKEIKNIYNYNETAYLSTAFGIVVINLSRKEIKETYRLGTSVTSVSILGNDIYAVTSNGVLKGSLSDNLIDPGNWHPYTVGTENDKVQQLCIFKNTLCFLLKGKGIYYQSGNDLRSILSSTSLTNMKVENEKLVAFSNSTLYLFSSLTESEKGSFSGISDVSSTKNENIFWLATGTSGITGIKRTAANKYEIIENEIKNDGPKRNYTFNLTMHNNQLYVVGGGRWDDRFYRTGTVMIYNTEDNKWNNIEDISGFTDATSIAIDPKDDSHFYVSSWGKGVYEFKNYEFATKYDRHNSILEGVNNSDSYVRIEGLCFDNAGNLWMTNSDIADVIKVMKADGSWSKISFSDIGTPNLADKILIRNNGDKWLNLVRGKKAGIFVFNENGTIDDTSDDTYHYFSSLNDSNGSVGASEYICITEDKNDNIWIGTNRGPVIVSNPSNVLINKENTNFERIVQTDENGNLSYFLRDERIKAIAVDGGNRKWIGTENSGVYLVNEDGSSIIEHFTTDNSPLLSNSIESIAIHNKSGEVFFGTDAGLISYWGDATAGSESYSDIYAYPNPVRPDFDDKVIITGLMENSNVKITDTKGNIIYQTKSVGGQISWNCRNVNNKKIAPGVYLVLASTPEAKESVVTKIAVVR
ncbi:archaellin [Parabacteroides sp. PF5-5]|uniref:type IX secretion system anionic LPS delivery protein PorZ n=1 Tax=unclassified Parabacteroides TaxID=2649774 RepID=UPI0024740787|nr:MULTISPECIES: two-component regulator propeller domain-containing protein [unclassified Parabacteroides]MDH6305965.1 archaellin [Parabacteroides sp. PH5-39]MDH6317221.1 archaellin [Parabacteroides sp. PF5-13]MDH6320677.1 archaellin [Parabacteroides sp. PH5-13]MDH6324402.1 archaellin [Parabacteroides sp. PH5-8]MDH6328406.1 archaellin [Parabacteroides sp. PH5-41]